MVYESKDLVDPVDNFGEAVHGIVEIYESNVLIDKGIDRVDVKEVIMENFIQNKMLYNEVKVNEKNDVINGNVKKVWELEVLLVSYEISNVIFEVVIMEEVI